jgi:hypothetical protein
MINRDKKRDNTKTQLIAPHDIFVRLKISGLKKRTGSIPVPGTSKIKGLARFTAECANPIFFILSRFMPNLQCSSMVNKKKLSRFLSRFVTVGFY